MKNTFKILFLVSVLSISFVFCVDTVKASSVALSYGFESTGVHSQVTILQSDFMTTFAGSEGDDDFVHDDYKHLGSNDYRLHGHFRVWFNFSMPTNTYIENVSFYYFMDNAATAFTGYWYLTDNNAGVNICDIRLGGTDNKRYIYQNDDVTELCRMYENTWYKIDLTYKSTYAYTLTVANWSGVIATHDYSCSQLAKNATGLYFYCNSNNLAQQSGVDDVGITVTSTGGSGSSGNDETGSIGGLATFCNSNYDAFMATAFTDKLSKREIELFESSELSMVISAFDLYVKEEQMLYVEDDLNNYSLYINGVPCGHPDSCFEYTGDTDIMRWIFTTDTISLNEEKLIIELINNGDDYNSYYWYFASGIGVGGSKTHTDGTYIDGIYNGGNNIYTPYYCLHYLSVTPQCSYSDTLTLSENSPYYECEPIYFDYTLESTGDTYITLWKSSGAKVTTNGYNGSGKLVESCLGKASFVPIKGDAGGYRVRITRNGVNTSVYKDFTVLGLSSDDYKGQIWTIPAVCQNAEYVKLYWYYNYTYWGDVGAILHTRSPDILDNPKIILTNIKSNNTNGLPWKFYEGINYIWLCQNTGTGYSSVDCFILPVGMSSFGNGEIYTDKEVYYLEDKKTVDITISGSHNSIGSNVYVRINGVKVLDVGDKSSFSFTKALVLPKTYNVELVLKGDSSNIEPIVLDNCSFIIKEGYEPSALGFNMKQLPSEIKVIGAVAIICLMTFSPLIISATLGGAINHKIQVPALLYLAFFFLGMIVTVWIGFVDAVWLFVIIFALIIGFAIMQVMKKGTAGADE